jgi:hypothetical protein
MSDWIDRLQRNPRVIRLDLAPLTEPEAAEQIELLLGQRPSRTVVADTYRRSEGNPSFTEQLIAAGLDHAPPAGLTSLLLARTGQVTRTARDVLAVLAVAPRPLDEASLARLVARPEPEVRNALRELLTRRLLRLGQHRRRRLGQLGLEMAERAVRRPRRVRRDLGAVDREQRQPHQPGLGAQPQDLGEQRPQRRRMPGPERAIVAWSGRCPPAITRKATSRRQRHSICRDERTPWQYA